MKNNIALLVCTVVLAVATNLSSAQPSRAEALPEPPDLPEPPTPPLAEERMAAEGYQFFTTTPGHGAGASRPLVIPKEAGDPKDFAEIEEDLNVMARILEKAASGRDDKHPRAMGIAIQGNLFGSPAAPKNLYIEGHGALFFLNVGFPLLPPATKSSEAEAKEKTSTEWEEARRELYRTPGSGFELNWKTPMFGGPAEEYDADKVEDLKRDVVAGLKNATHIRKLKSDETVTVVISGRSSNGETRMVRRNAGGGGAGARSGPGVVAIAKAGGGEGHGTRLILRSRKSDIDAFQKDKTTLEEFRKKVTMIVY